MEEKRKKVFKIWSDLFGEDDTKEDRNFFELGGDSMMALKMSEQLKQSGYTVSLMDVFDEPTLGGILKAVQPLGNVPEVSALTEEQRRCYPATIQQRWFFRKIRKGRDYWCEYAVVSPKGNNIASPRDIYEYLYDKNLLRNYRIIKNEKGLFFEMTDDKPKMICISGEKFNEITVGKIAGDNICLEKNRTCCMAYNDSGQMMIMIHHLFSDAVTLKNIITAVDSMKKNGHIPNTLYAVYAWDQYGAYDVFDDNLSYTDERTSENYDSNKISYTSDTELYSIFADISREWGVSAESVLMSLLCTAMKGENLFESAEIEVERMGRDMSGKWDDICGWLSYSAALDLSDADAADEKDRAVSINNVVSKLTFENNRLDGSEPERALTWNYVGNTDISSAFENYSVMSFGQFSGRTTGRSTPIYFAVYFKNGHLICEIDYDSLVYSGQQMRMFLDKFTDSCKKLTEKYGKKRTDELNSILEVMGGL